MSRLTLQKFHTLQKFQRKSIRKLNRLTRSTLTMYSILSDFLLTDFLTWGSSFFGLPLYTISFKFEDDLDICRKVEAIIMTCSVLWPLQLNI